ncbi:uncharacterized protein N7496_009743 [Penicillium cataractarum]|uniref:Retrovirus-related Pol polyprotein from transposon TNT 1-94-like beta-barrel domain-containing protein n=1 Tax=Penicillium cataractarum TaxID=2100454 RepID=A0A9W9V2F4_9EURO|nr:uncharacterized protein N7496_009743 [Penicillium cataractarum]KAJ5364030.1 hypothetical protein N7496_009743 [Penicillium cataractarum]
MPLAIEVADESHLPCPAWVWSNLSNVHVAKDRSWFGNDYTPFESFLEDGLIKVIGVGTVDLPVKLGPDSHSILRLENVLHVPNMFCNIVGDLTRHGYGMLVNKFVDEWTNQTVAHLTVDHDLWVVVLSEFPHGPRVGPSPFEKSTCYSISATWPETERLRFEALKQPRPALQDQPVLKSLTSDEQKRLEKKAA